jgi:hypothetical protein
MWNLRLGVSIAIAAVAIVSICFPPKSSELPSLDAVDDPTTEFRTSRLIAMDLLVHDAVDGRRSLLEVAALFRALLRSPPAAPATSPLTGLPNFASEEIRLCHCVIVWAERADANRLDGLKGELRRLQAAGPIRLPDPANLESVHELVARARNHPAAPTSRSRAGRGN